MENFGLFNPGCVSVNEVKLFIWMISDGYCNRRTFLCYLTHELGDDPVKHWTSVSEPMFSCAEGSEIFCKNTILFLNKKETMQIFIAQ